jgi:hypothetical protein
MERYQIVLIDKKNRILYQINNQIVTVFIISAKGHYGDK